MADQGTYFARLPRIPFASNGIRSYAFAGQIFTPEAGWLAVTGPHVVRRITRARTASTPAGTRSHQRGGLRRTTAIA